MSRWMCAQFAFHHQFGIVPGGQILGNRQTVFFLPVDPMNQQHKDPDTIDLGGAPRLAQSMHKAWKKHQNTVYWVDINLAQKKRLKFHYTHRTPSLFTEHSELVVSRKLFGRNLEKSYTEKVYESPRMPPKISLRHDWM